MAYDTEYRGTWNVMAADSGPAYQAWTVDLMREGSFTPTAILMGPDPVRVTGTKIDTAVPYGIVRHGAVLELVDNGLSPNDAVFGELRGGTPQKWVMKVNDGTRDVFVGYVDPHRMRREVNVKPRQLAVATDGLDYLRSVAWYASDVAARADGFQTPLTLIDDILANIPYDTTGTGRYGIQTSCKWAAYDASLTGWGALADDPLHSHTINAGWLYRKILLRGGGSSVTEAEAQGRTVSCYDALEQILADWQLQLSWGEGLWNLRQVAYYDNTASGAYYWTYGHNPTQLTLGSQGYKTSDVYINWNDSDVKWSGSGYTFDTGPQYETARVLWDHEVEGNQLLEPYWDGSTFQWTERNSPTPVKINTMPGINPADNGVFTTGGQVQLSAIRLNTETDENNLSTEADVRTDWLALVNATPSAAIAIEYEGAYPIQQGDTNDIGLDVYAWYSLSVALTSAYRFYLAGFALGVSDGTNTFWLTNGGSVAADWVQETHPADARIWTRAVTPGAATKCTIPTAELPGLTEGVAAGALLTVKVRLFQGVDTYYGWNSSADTVDVFAWGPARVYLAPNGTAPNTRVTYETVNSGAVLFDVVEQEVVHGSGPFDFSPSRIAGTASPYANLYDSWSTDGTDSNYDFGQLWGRELLKQFGTAPEILNVTLLACTTAGQAVTLNRYVRAGTALTDMYWPHRMTIRPRKDGLYVEFTGQQVRQDSITLATTPFVPDTWPTPLGPGDLLSEDTGLGWPATVEFETTDTLSVTADVAETGITLEDALTVPLYEDMPLRFVPRLAPGTRYEVYVAADAAVGDTTIDVTWAVTASFKLGGYFSFSAQTYEWIRQFQRRNERSTSPYFSVVEQWSLSNRTFLRDKGKDADFIVIGSAGHRVTLPRTSNVYDVTRAGIEMTTLSGSPPSIPISYTGWGQVFDQPFTVAVAFRSDNVADLKTVFKITYTTGWVKGVHSTNEFSLYTQDGTTTDTGTPATAATSNGIWNVAFWSFTPSTGAATVRAAKVEGDGSLDAQSDTHTNIPSGSATAFELWADDDADLIIAVLEVYSKALTNAEAQHAAYDITRHLSDTHALTVTVPPSGVIQYLNGIRHPVTASPTSGQVLVADGAGNVAWANQGGTPGSTTPTTGNSVAHTLALGTADAWYYSVPYASSIVKMTASLHKALSTADEVLTLKNNAGTSMGTITLVQSGSAAGDTYSLTPTANNDLAEGDNYRIETDGGNSDTAARVGVVVSFGSGTVDVGAGLIARWTADQLTGKSDGDDAVTYNTSDSWQDDDGNGYYLNCANTAEEPTYHANVLNGYPVIRFDSTQSLRTSTSAGAAQAYLHSVLFDTTANALTLVALVKFDSGEAASNQQIFSKNTVQLNYLTSAGGQIQFDALNSSTARLTATAPSGFLDAWKFVVARRNGAYMDVRVNGVTVATKTDASGTSDTSQVMALADGSFTGDVAYWAMHDEYMTDSNVLTLEAQFTAKYDLGF